MQPFDFIECNSLEEVAKLSQLHGFKAQLFAGGVDVLYLMKDAVTSPQMPFPKYLISLNKIPDLYGICTDEGYVSIGAMTKLIEVIESVVIQQNFPILASASSQIASPQIRNVSTIAGNLCQRPRCSYFRKREIQCLKKSGEKCWAYDGEHRDYYTIFQSGRCCAVHPSDLATVLLALHAEIEIYSDMGKRKIPIEEFFVTPSDNIHQENILEKGQVITRILIPKRAYQQIYLKSIVRQSSEYSLVNVAITAQRENQICREINICLGGVAATPYKARVVEEILCGQQLKKR